MKILRTIVILALVAGLVLGGVGTAFAKKPPDVPRGGGPHSPGKRGLSGNVTSVQTINAGEEYIIDLETKHWGTVAITANVTAKYMVPRETKGPKDLATFLDIVGEPPDIVGRRLAVLVTFTDNVTADAIRLMLIPDGPPLHAHRVGVVEVGAFDPSTSITIIDREGVSHTFTVSVDTVYRPSAEDGGISELTGDALIDAIEEGCVTVVTKGGAGAKAIVLHEPPLPDWAP